MDRKRVTGPELSVPPIFKNSAIRKPILNEKNRRLDDRNSDDLRPICKFFLFCYLFCPRTSLPMTICSLSYLLFYSHENRIGDSGEWINLYRNGKYQGGLCCVSNEKQQMAGFDKANPLTHFLYTTILNF